MRGAGDAIVLAVFAIGIIIVLVTSPSPGSEGGYDGTTSSTYSQSYSSSNDGSSQQYMNDSSWDGDTIVLVVMLVIGIPLLLSFRSVRSGLLGAAGGLLGHPKGILWFFFGFIGAVMAMMWINPDPSSYEVPPVLIALGVGVLAAGVGSFK